MQGEVMVIAERIENLREIRGLKQYQLAEKIGVTRATMCKYERGTNIPNAEIVAKLAVALDTTADYLCGLSDNYSPNGDSYMYVGGDRELVETVLSLSRDNKIRLSERARILLEEQIEKIK